VTVLSVAGLGVRYGGVHALTGVDLDVWEGQIVGLIGPNGAGKTTFIDAISGFTRCHGQVLLDGIDITRAAPHRRAHRGLVRTWQSAELFDDLTVAENLAVSNRRRWWSSVAETVGRNVPHNPRVLEALALLGLDPLAGHLPGELSQGQRKLVGVARAVAAAPRLICLDEPAAGLDTQESQRLGEHLRTIAHAGTAMLLVDHDMGLVLGVCDHVVVLDFGRVIAAGPPSRIRTDPAVLVAYLGASGTDRAAATTSPIAPS
jgi:ABC-type branched-subunit amino acid transport system ATPase component